MTSATGAGHDTHAAAAKAWCGRIYGDAVDVRIEHVLEDSHALCRAGVEFYNQIQLRAPWFHHVYYNLLEIPGFREHDDVWPGRDYCVRLLEEIRPDAVLSTHDCLNRGYFELARKVLGGGVRCATFCAEFGGGYGFSRNWVNRRADYFFARTGEAGQAARCLGMADERVVVSGHWAPPAFYSPPMEETERRKYLQEHLGLESDRFTLLLSTGGNGAQNHADILRELRAVGKEIQVVALCGRNEEGRASLEQWVAKEVDFPVRLLPFTREMPQLLKVCSAVVARAGATTAGESLLSGCPVIFNAMGGMMPQESPTWRYFQERGIEFRMSNPQGLVDVVRGWLDNPVEYDVFKKRLAEWRDGSTPERALRLLLD